MNALAQKVHAALNEATGNGYDMGDMSSEAIAIDLAYMDCDLENTEIVDIIPHVKSWKLLQTLEAL